MKIEFIPVIHFANRANENKKIRKPVCLPHNRKSFEQFWPDN